MSHFRIRNRATPCCSLLTSVCSNLFSGRADKNQACTVGTYAEQETLENSFPDLSFNTDHVSYAKVGESLLGGECAAAILPKVDFDSTANNPRFCELTVVGASLYFSVAGWVTNLNSTMCIQRPIEYALHKLQSSGFAKVNFKKWMPQAACDASPRDRVGGGGVTAAARRLVEGDGGRSAAHSGRRRLKGSASSGAVAGEAGLGELTVMHPEQFAGVFLLWAATVVFVLMVKAGIFLHQRCKSMLAAKASVAEVQADDLMADKEAAESAISPPLGRTSRVSLAVGLGTPKSTPTPNRKASNFNAHERGHADKYPDGIDINSTASMLRYLVVRARTPTPRLTR